MNVPNHKQLVLSSGDQVILEVIDDTTDNVVTRRPLKIQEMVTEEGSPYYLFKPFMAFQENETDIVIIRNDCIMGIGKPCLGLIDQYESYFIETKPKDDSDQYAYSELTTIH